MKRRDRVSADTQIHAISCITLARQKLYVCQTMCTKVSEGVKSCQELSEVIKIDFDGGTEGRTLNRMRTHANPRIISPGHYR